MNRSKVKGTLEQNTAHSKIMIANEHNLQKSLHYRAVNETGMYIAKNGPLVKTQEAGRVYSEVKGLDKKKMCCALYEIFS